MPSRNYYRKPARPWTRRFIAIVMVLVFIYAASQLVGYIVQQKQTKQLYTELAEQCTTTQPPEATSDPSPTPTEKPTSTPASSTAAQRPLVTQMLRQQPEMLEAYQQLWARNNDMVGWLKMDALSQVDFPVVQRDQSYYLRRDFDGNNNSNGTAFLDMECSIWPQDDNLIIYAHNMKSGMMFGQLHKLLDESNYKTAPLTIFNTIYERGLYVPIAAFVCTIVPGDEFFNYTVKNFKTQAVFDDFIAQAQALSSIKTPYDIQYGDQLLTLVTCYDEAGLQRLIVLLRRVRSDENISVLRTLWQ